MNDDHLFFKDDLDAQLRARQKEAERAVDAIPQEQFLVSNDGEIIDHIVAKHNVKPLVLQEEATEMNQTETKVDVSGDQMRFFSPFHSGPFLIPGTRVDVDIPHTGDDWVFRYRTNPFSTVSPRGTVNSGRLRISISLPHDLPPEQFKVRYDSEVEQIRKYVAWSHSQVVSYNHQLSGVVQHAVKDRRDRLEKHDKIAALLDIPLATRAGAPSMTPVRVEIRRPPTTTGTAENRPCS